jgi:hypothetical protein
MTKWLLLQGMAGGQSTKVMFEWRSEYWSKVWPRCMNGDHWQKGMVGIVKGFGETILELNKRECLISLLECWDDVVRQNMVWRYKVIAHCAGITIFGIPTIRAIVIFYGPGSSAIILATPISPLVQDVGESLLPSVLLIHQRTITRWRRQNISLCCKFCWISSWSPVPHCEYVCAYSTSWATGKRYWLERVGVCIMSFNGTTGWCRGASRLVSLPR